MNLLSCVIVATTRCNLACKYCSVLAPCLRPIDFQASDYLATLQTLEANDVYFNDIAIYGGEPFCHPNLTQFVKDFRDGYTGGITIGTNGKFLLDGFEKYDELLNVVTFMSIATYPDVFPGGSNNIKVREFLEYAGKHYPHLRLYIHEADYFFPHKFLAGADAMARCGLQDRFTMVMSHDGGLYHCCFLMMADMNYHDVKKVRVHRNFEIFKSHIHKNEVRFDVSNFEQNQFLNFLYHSSGYRCCQHHYWDIKNYHDELRAANCDIPWMYKQPHDFSVPHKAFGGKV